MYAYATNVRTPAKPSLVSADPANSAPHSLAHLCSPHSCGRRRDGHTARAVPWFIDYLSRLQPFFALSAFTHNDESGIYAIILSLPGAGQAPVRRYPRAMYLRACCCPKPTQGSARGWRVPGCLLGLLALGPQLQPRCSTGRAVNPPTCGCQTCSGIAFPLTLSWATRPLRLERIIAVRSQREAAGYRSLLRPLR